MCDLYVYSPPKEFFLEDESLMIVYRRIGRCTPYTNSFLTTGYTGIYEYFYCFHSSGQGYGSNDH